MKRVILFILSINLVFEAGLPLSQQKVAEDIELQRNSLISPLNFVHQATRTETA